MELYRNAIQLVHLTTDRLDLEVFKKYPLLSVDEIKDLVLSSKWYHSWLVDLQDEIERVTLSLANRIKTLEERYNKPLGEIDSEVKGLETRVETHLKAMGLLW